MDHGERSRLIEEHYGSRLDHRTNRRGYSFCATLAVHTAEQAGWRGMMDFNTLLGINALNLYQLDKGLLTAGTMLDLYANTVTAAQITAAQITYKLVYGE